MDNKTEIINLFKAIIADFPDFTMQYDNNPKNVDLSIDIANQPGLPFDINLNLQGDELHLNAESFWCEWFPCTDPKIVKDFRESVYGLLSGRYRIVEQYCGKRPVKADLQNDHQGKWETKATWTTTHFTFLKNKSIKILQKSTVALPDSK